MMVSQETNDEVVVQLKLVRFEHDPGEVTALLGVVPSKVWRKGDNIDGSTRTYDGNGWRLTADRRASDVDSGVDALLAHLAPSWDRLRAFSRECHSELSIVIYARVQMPAIHLRFDQIERFAELAADLDVDVYCVSG